MFILLYHSSLFHVYFFSIAPKFEQAEEAEQLRNELAAIDAELDLGKQEAPIVMDEDTEVKSVVEILNEDDDEEETEVA